MTPQTELPPREPFEDHARRRVSLGLLIGEVRRSADITLDQDKLRQRLESLAAGYPNPEEVIRAYTANRDLMGQLETSIIEEQVVDWLLERAKIKDKPIAFEELMKPE